MHSLVTEVNQETKNIVIRNNEKVVTSIEYDKDINFTPLVDYLSMLLDGTEQIDIQDVPQYQDEKVKIALKIIDYMFKNFNKVQVESIENRTDG